MSGSDSYHIFDRDLLRQRRARVARHFADYDVLHHEVAERLLERRADVKREFAQVLDLGCHDGFLARAFRDGGAQVVATDLSADFLQSVPSPVVVADEEFLPFAAQSFDLIVSNLNFHAVNDLPGALLQCRSILRPDGLLLASMLGGATLWQLRQCLYEAEQAVAGGVSPRIAPFVELRDAAGLLQRAGFALPVADSEVVSIAYPHLFALMQDLRGMGLSNVLQNRLRQPTRRAVFAEAARLYADKFPAPDGGIQADFDVIFLHGWTAA